MVRSDFRQELTIPRQGQSRIRTPFPLAELGKRAHGKVQVREGDAAGGRSASAGACVLLGCEGTGRPEVIEAPL